MSHQSVQNFNGEKGQGKIILIAILFLSVLLGIGVYLYLFAKNLKKPTIKAKDVKLEKVDFKTIDLTVNFAIQNPNNLSVSLAGFSYDFQVQDKSIVSGDKEEKTQIKANGESILGVPISLSYLNLYQKIGNFKDKEELDFKLLIEPKIELPGLGRIKLPITIPGKIPIIQVPKITNLSLVKKSIEKPNLLSGSLGSAKLEVKVEIENPNHFPLEIATFNYDFLVNKQKWANGQQSQGVTFPKGAKTTLVIPVSVSFTEMGKSALSLITGGGQANYQLKGSIEFKTPLKIAPSLTWKFEKEGQTKIQ